MTNDKMPPPPIILPKSPITLEDIQGLVNAGRIDEARARFSAEATKALRAVCDHHRNYRINA